MVVGRQAGCWGNNQELHSGPQKPCQSTTHKRNWSTKHQSKFPILCFERQDIAEAGDTVQLQSARQHTGSIPSTRETKQQHKASHRWGENICKSFPSIYTSYKQHTCNVYEQYPGLYRKQPHLYVLSTLLFFNWDRIISFSPCLALDNQ